MKKLTEKVQKYVNETLLSLDNLPKEKYEDRSAWVDKFTERLFLRKYRKYAISDSVRDFVKERLAGIIDNKLPLRFVPSFGGYKHWWTPTYPAVDWAEVFNMKFLLEYLAPIYNSYDLNEFEIEYESEEVILHELNNVPQSGLDEYTNTFREVLQYFNTHQKAAKMKLTLAREQYEAVGFSKEKLLARIQEMIPEFTAIFDAYDEDDKLRRLQKVKTNFKLDGGNPPHDETKDYTKITEAKRTKLYKDSRILNEAFLAADFEVRGETFFDSKEVVPLLFSFGLGPGGEAWLHIGSCTTSMVDFWAGVGILEVRDNGEINQRIVSRTQYEIIKGSLVECKIKTPLSGIHKNFKNILVYQGMLNF